MARNIARTVIASVTVGLMFGAGVGRLSAQPENTSEPNGDRVRIFDPALRLAFDKGMSRSPTFVALVAYLQQADVIVYLSRGACPGRHVVGCVVSVNHGGRWRYVRINFVVFRESEATALWRSPKRLTAQIGHELQHAIEIADDPSIVDARSLERAYSRKGPRRNDIGYETTAAIEAGEHVLKDLTRRSSPAPARRRAWLRPRR